MAFADATTARLVKEGTLPCKVLLATACGIGDLIGYSSGWKRADGDGAIAARLVAGEAGIIGQYITAYRAAVVSGFTGGTAGNFLYPSTTAGGYADSASTVNQVVALMLSGTEAHVEPLWSVANS